VCRSGGDIVAAGKFHFTGQTGVLSHNAARWNGSSWHAMPGMEPESTGYPAVWAAQSFQGSAFVGGSFRLTGLPYWDAVARWDGSAWRSTDPPLSGTTRALVSYQARLIAAGHLFLPSISVSVAAYNGISWQPMWTVPGVATHLAVNGNDLFVAAYESFSGPGHIYRWNGYLWDAMPLTPSRVTALGSHQGSLIAAIDATGAAGELGVMRWDGETWQWISPSPGEPSGGRVESLISDGQTLFAGGYVATSAFSPFVNALRDGAWHNISQLSGGLVWVLFADSGGGWAGGTFASAAGQTSPALARWSLAAPCYPNCDCSATSPVLNVNDFVCFNTRYAAGSSYANCDGSTASPVLNVADFICFMNKYAAGCP
jgi:hypothetical protein